MIGDVRFRVRKRDVQWIQGDLKSGHQDDGMRTLQPLLQVCAEDPSWEPSTSAAALKKRAQGFSGLTTAGVYRYLNKLRRDRTSSYMTARELSFATKWLSTAQLAFVEEIPKANRVKQQLIDYYIEKGTFPEYLEQEERANCGPSFCAFIDQEVAEQTAVDELYEKQGVTRASHGRVGDPKAFKLDGRMPNFRSLNGRVSLMNAPFLESEWTYQMQQYRREQHPLSGVA